MSGSVDAKYSVLIKLPFLTPTCAQIAYDVLRVDAEPRRSQVFKTLTVQGFYLNAEFKSSSLKSLRVGVNSFFEYVVLVIETIEKFGPPVSESYSHYGCDA